MWNLADLMDTVDGRDADASHLAVDKHLAGAALADATVEATVATLKTMAMYWVAGLMQRCGYCVAFQTFDRLAVEQEFDNLRLGDVENRMSFDSVHIINRLKISDCKSTTFLRNDSFFEKNFFSNQISLLPNGGKRLGR
jgi:hypothetical protein